MADSANTNAETETQEPTNFAVLAAEKFGTNYTGEIPEKTEETEESTPDDEAESDTEVEDVDAEDETEAETDAEEGEPEEATISSFSELVESQGWDPEWAKSLELDVKVNGESGKAKLEDLIKSYQIQEAAESRLNEAKEKAQSITKELSERQEKLNEQFAVAAELLAEEKQSLEAKEAELDNGNLDKIDPADYAAKKLKLQQERSKLDQKIQKATEKYQESIKSSEAEQQKAIQEYKSEQQEKLVQAIPEWKNPDTAKAEGAEIFNYLVKQGIPKEDVANILAHEYIVLARKAMMYDRSQNKTDAAKKKVAKIPKVLKPGNAQSPEKANLNKISQAKDRLKTSGSIEDALAMLKAARG